YTTLFRSLVEGDSLADWRFVAEIHFCQRLVDDDDHRGALNVGGGERATRNEWHPHHREIVGTDLSVDDLRTPLAGRPARDSEVAGPACLGERDLRCQRDACYRRERL